MERLEPIDCRSVTISVRTDGSRQRPRPNAKCPNGARLDAAVTATTAATAVTAVTAAAAATTTAATTAVTATTAAGHHGRLKNN